MFQREFKLLCLFSLVKGSFGQRIGQRREQVNKGKDYKVTIPDFSDPNARHLVDQCAIREDDFRCIFETDLYEVTVELDFICDWDYDVGLDPREADCTCSAILDKATNKTRNCGCAGCPRDDDRRRLSSSSKSSRGKSSSIEEPWVPPFGAALYCMDEFVIDNCTSVDCDGVCNGLRGLENVEFDVEVDYGDLTGVVESGLVSGDDVEELDAAIGTLESAGVSKESIISSIENEIYDVIYINTLAESLLNGDLTAEEAQEPFEDIKSIADSLLLTNAPEESMDAPEESMDEIITDAPAPVNPRPTPPPRPIVDASEPAMADYGDLTELVDSGMISGDEVEELEFAIGILEGAGVSRASIISSIANETYNLESIRSFSESVLFGNLTAEEVQELFV